MYNCDKTKVRTVSYKSITAAEGTMGDVVCKVGEHPQKLSLSLPKEA
jgi:hypothetical protein